jgi:hypothetical protein
LKTYPVLRFISFVIRLAGWLLMLAGLLGMAIFVSTQDHASDVITYGPFFIYGCVGATVSGLLLVFFGELARVSVDIDLNTTRVS